MKISQKTIIYGLIVLLAIAVCYIVVTEYRNYQNSKLEAAFNNGFDYAQLYIASEIISQINTNGYVVFNAPADNNQTVAVKLGIIGYANEAGNSGANQTANKTSVK